MHKRFIFLSFVLMLLAACDQVNQRLGLDDSVKKEAEGKAVGSACRQSGRAIEDCYSVYNWLPKSAIYAGWREMDAYMRENQLETVAPQLPPAPPPPPPPEPKKKKKKAPAEGESEGKPAGEDKAGDKADEKTSPKAEARH